MEQRCVTFLGQDDPQNHPRRNRGTNWGKPAPCQPNKPCVARFSPGNRSRGQILVRNAKLVSRKHLPVFVSTCRDVPWGVLTCPQKSHWCLKQSLRANTGKTNLLCGDYRAREMCTLIASTRKCCHVPLPPMDFGQISISLLSITCIPLFCSFSRISWYCGYFWSLLKCVLNLCGEKWWAVLNNFENVLLGKSKYRHYTSTDACVTATIRSKVRANKFQSIVQEIMYFGREMLQGQFSSK